MPEEAGFQAELASALEGMASRLAADVLPMLKESFKLFQSLLSNLYNLLHRKSLIQEDPYQYDRKLTEVVLPSRGPIANSEKKEQLSRRLAEYQSQLEFLNGTYQFSLEFLGLERLRLLGGLVRFVDWPNLMTASQDATTTVLAEALGRIKLGADKISAGVAGDFSVQLAALAHRILAGLREVGAWQRESYKLGLRRGVFARLGPELAQTAKAGAGEALPRLQRALRQLEPERPFYSELVREVLAEDFSEDGPRLRAETLARLSKVEPKPAAAAAATVDYRGMLLEAVRLMVPLRLHLGEALATLESNRSGGRRRGLAAHLWALFGARRAVESVLEIRQFDNATGVTRSTRVNFPEFADKVRKKTALLEALASSTSPAAVRLRAAAEPEIYEFLNKNLGELHEMYRTMAGLDAYFKSARKEAARGIRIELSAVKNGLVRANKQRYEYTARKEEEKQRQQLGLS